MSYKPPTIVSRPGLGKEGRPIRVRANFFQVKTLPGANVHHYDITITPEVPPGLNRKIYKQFEELNSDRLGRIKPVYDGRQNLYTAKPLPFDSASFSVILPEDNVAPATARRPPRSFNVKIRKVAEINLEELQRFLNGKCAISNNILTAIMSLDVLIHHKPSMMHAVAGKSFYTNQGSRVLYGGLEVWQGYYQSARPTPGKMMINVDLSATAFYQSGSLVQMVVKILEKHTPDDLRRIRNEDITKLDKILKNLKINVIHRGENASRRRWKITRISNTSANNTIFEINGQRTNVAEYFERTYGRRLQYPFLPCVIVRRTTSLPMEVCNVIEGQRYMRKLNERQTAEMIKFTCQPPNARANKINQGLEILNYRQNEHMQQFGLQVNNEMAVVQARVIPAPTVKYNPSSKVATFVPKEGAWNLRDRKVATGATLGSWACAVFVSQRDCPLPIVQRFIRELVATCIDTGMNIPNMMPPIEYFNVQSNVDNNLKIIWTKAGNEAKSQPQLILCVLPNTGVKLYAEIKRVTDTVIGVASQCVQGKHVYQAKKPYCANVCLKINVKLGGMNSFIDPEQIPFISDDPTIIIGADVTHPGPGDTTGRPSIAAMCASMDSRASRYAATIRIQSGRQEVISDLAGMVKELLKTFYQTCGFKPMRILFYRDGVSEGQFKEVLEQETMKIKDACRSLEESYNPTITFVVVQKRHHTRFFPMDKKDSDRSGNCLPGTVVDTGVVHPFEFDFYLQSHAGLQGTSRPTHYHVLYDENGFTPDSLQSLSYYLCYIYARCTRSVSLVPPVYYADLVCTRARFHASGENWSDPDASEGPSSYAAVKDELRKVMYFM